MPDNSIVDLELKAILLEHDFIDKDIQTRKTSQQSLTNQALVFIGVSIPIVSTLVQSGFLDILLIVPVVFVLIGLFFFEHDFEIIIKKDYKYNTLEPLIEAKIRARCGTETQYFNYARFQHIKLAENSIAAARTIVFCTVRYLLAIVPTVISLGAFLILKTGPLRQLPVWEVLFYAMDAFALVAYVFLVGHFYFQYRFGLLAAERGVGSRTVAVLRRLSVVAGAAAILAFLVAAVLWLFVRT